MARWLLLVAMELFNPSAGYFRTCPDNSSHLEPDPEAGLIGTLGDRLHGFRLAGRLLAFAARLNLPIPAPVNIAALKFFFGAPILLEDLDQVCCHLPTFKPQSQLLPCILDSKMN